MTEERKSKTAEERLWNWLLAHMDEDHTRPRAIYDYVTRYWKPKEQKP